MWTVAVGTAALVLAMASVANGQPCRADFDSSGAVEINELIAAVNEALSGCGSGATPTRRANTPTRTPTEPPAVACPYRFNQAVDSDRFCGYSGDIRSNCSPFPVESGWVTNGTTVIALAVDRAGDSLAVEGRRTNPNTASVTGLSFGPDFDEVFPASGTISLPSGSRLRFTFNAGGSCGTYTHDGTFVRLIGSSTAASAAGLGDLREQIAGALRGAAQAARSDSGRAASALLRALSERAGGRD